MARRRRDPGNSPADLALRLAPLLPEPNALIGGLAVTAHGYVRATDDVDFICPADPKEIQARLQAAGIESAIRRGDFLEGDIRSVVYGTIDGIRFDVLFPPVPINWAHRVVLSIEEGRAPLSVVDLEGLIRLKLRAGGPQDLIDVVHLLRRRPELRQKAVDVAQAYGVRSHLEAWLADPRIRSPEEPAPLEPWSADRTSEAAPSKGRRRKRRATR